MHKRLIWMIRKTQLLIFFLSLIIFPDMSGKGLRIPFMSFAAVPDTIIEDQILYNGRIWRNQYLNLENDQFLFTTEFLPGSVTIGGSNFKNIVLKYDIYNDEIITPVSMPGIVQLNKEMVDSFSLSFENKLYRFSKITGDSMANLRGYVNVLYKGKSALYMRFIKELYHMSGQNVNDRFFQKSQLYFVKDKTVYPVNNRRDLFSLFKESKAQIKEFIKRNSIEVSRKDPDSFVPVVRYIDSLDKK
jgi:hypothetical protein